MEFQQKMEEITFLIRYAPSRSTLAGKLVAELKCNAQVKITPLLRQHGLDDITVLEATRYYAMGGRGPQWKILRFVADPSIYRQLHTLCSPSDIEEIAKNTDAHLARLSTDVSRKELVRMKKDALMEYAKLVPGYDEAIDYTKKQLADLIIAAVDQAPLAA